MNHFFDQITGWFTFPRMYHDMVARLPNGSRFVEVGVYEGKSFAYLLVETVNQEKHFEVYAVDSFTFTDEFNGNPENIQIVFERNLSGLTGKFVTIKGDSAESADLFEDESVDFVFLDADHIFPRVKSDIEAWWPKIKKGGILAGHDHCPEHPGVAQAVEQVFGDDWDKSYLDELVWMKEKK